MIEGTHPIHRRLLIHWIWSDKPFRNGQAWVDLILLANHKDSKASLRGQLFEVKRGQVFRSKLVLGKRWGWSRGKVARFLKLLESDQMIVQHTGQHATTITLLNYDRLHKGAFKNRTTDETPNEQQTSTKRDTYNNGKNDKNEKKEQTVVWFEEAWNSYPLKIGRKTAERHFNATVKTEEDMARLRKALANYCNSEPVKKNFIQHGSRWFASWEDWVANPASTPARAMPTMKCPVAGCVGKNPMTQVEYLEHRPKCEERFHTENKGPLPPKIRALVDQACGRKPCPD